MVRSMTGFGSATGEFDGVAFSVEIRSVNNRFLDINFRAPEEVSPLESDINDLLREKLKRGTVNIGIRTNLGRKDGPMEVSIDEAVLKQYLDSLANLQREAQNTLLKPSHDLVNLYQLPGVVTLKAPDIDKDALGPEVLSVVKEALEHLISMRGKEGSHLHADLSSRIDEIEASCNAIGDRVEPQRQGIRQRLTERIEEFLQNQPVDRDRLEQEIAYLIDKADIAEELTRMKSHFDQFRSLLDSDDAVGRKLEFLVQEMHREVNTMGSKSADTVISEHVVTCKSVVEQLREQVRNVE